MKKTLLILRKILSAPLRLIAIILITLTFILDLLIKYIENKSFDKYKFYLLILKTVIKNSKKGIDSKITSHITFSDEKGTKLSWNDSTIFSKNNEDANFTTFKF